MYKTKNKYLSLGEKSINQLKEISHELGLSDTMATRYAIALLHKKIITSSDEVNGLNLIKND